MEIKRFLAVRAIAWLVAGLLVGGVASDLWWRQRASDLRKRLDEQTQRTANVESKLAEAEARIKQLEKDLEAEQSLRRKLEELVSRGQK